MGGKIWPPGDLHSHLTSSGTIKTVPAELFSDASAEACLISTEIAKMLHIVLVNLAIRVMISPLGKCGRSILMVA